MLAQANDRLRCLGCTQLLTFGDDATVPSAQLHACLGRCDWVLLERGGHQISADPRPDGPAYR